MTIEMQKLATMHKAVAAAIEKAMREDASITPNDITAYFDECVIGMKVTLAFRPSRENFLIGLRDEQ